METGGTGEEFVNLDLLYSSVARSLYRRLKETETKNRPDVQKDINPHTRATIINSLFRFLASYISVLSLLDYGMLCYVPSLVAASAVFLGTFMLFSSQKPWTMTLRDYTEYQPSDLYECVNALHTLVRECPNFESGEIRKKYSDDKYKSVAKMDCPHPIPREYFENISS